MSSQRELALYLNNLQGHTTQQKIEAILEMEADCNLDEVCLMKVINWAELWENLSSGFPTRSGTNQTVQPQ